MVFDGKGQITQANDAALAALDVSPERILDKTLFKSGCRVIGEDGRRLRVAEQPWRRALKTNALIPDVVTGIITEPGICRWQQSTSMPVTQTDSRHPHSVITILTDITRYKQTQVQLLQSQKMEAIGRLASGLSHDFNNILTCVRSAAQLLLVDMKEGSHDNNLLLDITNETIRGAQLIRQLLFFSKPSAQNKELIDVNARLGQLCHLLRRTIPRTTRIETILSHEPIHTRFRHGT